jgi:hypothetical protein
VCYSMYYPGSNLQEHVAVQRQVGDELLQAGVIHLELAHAPKLGVAQPGVFALPVVEGGLADPILHQTSVVGVPVCACCRANRIWDSVNLDFFMAVFLG